MKQYDIVLLDPPWEYADRRLIRKDGKKAKRGIGSGNIYDCMAIAEMAKLPILNICKKDCVMFMWTTFPHLENALYLIKEYGFRYKTVGFNWIKVNKDNVTPFFGVGYYCKSNIEVCLLATRGKTIKPACNNISSVVMAQHPRDQLTHKIIHSAKPDEVREKITRLYPTQDKIELFARNKYDDPTWDATGFEYDGRDIRDFLKGSVA